MHGSPSSQTGSSPADTLLRRQRARQLSDLTIADLLQALIKRWQIVAVTVGLCVGIGVVAILVFPASYVSSGFLVVDSRRSSIPEIGIVSVQPADPRIAPSEGKVLQAPEFLGALVERLKLDELPTIIEAVDKNPKVLQSTSLAAITDPAERIAAARRAAAVDWLGKHMSVRGEERSYAITVAMESSDPQLSAQIVNSAMKLYLDRRTADDQELVSRASASIAQRHTEIRKEVNDLEQQILERRTALGLISTKAGRIETLDLVNLGNEVRLNEQKLAELREALEHAKAAAASGRWQDVDNSVASPYLLKLLEQEAYTARDRANVASNFGALHPDMERLQKQIDSIHQRLRAEVGRIAQSLSSEIEALDKRQSELEAQIAEAQEASLVSEKTEERIAQLDQELKSKRELLAAYDTRLQQLAASVGSGSVRLGAWATPPLKPAGPAPLVLVALCGIFGGLLGGAYVVLQRRFGDRLESTDEVVAVAGLPVIGAIPHIKCKRRDPRIVWSNVRGEPHGVIAESIRAVLVRIQFSLKSDRGILLVTSALAGEGKSSICLAMAQQAAISGKRVLLVDADLFRAGVTRALGIERPVPPTTHSVDAKILIVEDLQTGLNVLAAPRTFSPQQQNRALQRLHGLLHEARSRYDLVIVDTPPLMHVSDATLLAPQADGILLVASWEKPSRSIFIEALERIEPAGRPIIGIALSKVKKGVERTYLYGGYVRAMSHPSTESLVPARFPGGEAAYAAQRHA